MADKNNFSDINLSQQINLLEILFENMPMGIAIIDSKFCIQRYNPTWYGFSKLYAPQDSAPLEIGVNYFDHIPGAEETVKPLFESVLAGETIRQEAFELSAGGILSYWDIVLTPIIDKGKVLGILNVSVDVTEQVTTQQNLEQRVEERTHELSMLLESSQKLSSTLRLDPLLELILDHLGAAVEYDAASIMVLEEDTLKIAAYQGPIKRERVFDIRFRLEETTANQSVIDEKKPVIIPDIRGEGELARSIRDAAGEELDTTYDYLQCWMGVPLVIKDKVIGMLTLDHKKTYYYNLHHANIAMMFANQAAVAIENARLYRSEQERLEESERRRRVAEGFGKILAILNSNRTLDNILNYVTNQAQQLTEADASVIYMLGSNKQTLELVAGCHLPKEFSNLGKLSYSDSSALDAILGGEPYVVDNVQILHDSYSTKAPPLLTAFVLKYYKSALLVPVIISDVVYGAIALFFNEPRKFEEEAISLAVSFADQTALAIENANLRIQAEETAVAAERNRLARDLHDAVTQTLFSSSMIADVLPQIWERNPEMGRQRLDELRELTRGALAEMRTLLMELRPAALENSSIEELFEQLTVSITGRARIPVELKINGECELPVEVKVVFYRIAQEALNNIAKHSDGTSASVTLNCSPSKVELTIEDDGKGFDLNQVSSGSLGLGIMQERAANINATIHIESQICEGTCIQAIWQNEEVHNDRN